MVGLGCPGKFFLDRMSVDDLKSSAPETLTLLRERLLGRTDVRETVHFCGMAHTNQSSFQFFLPRQSNDETNTDQQTAALTMKALVRYGKEIPGRKGTKAASAGDPSLISLIHDLAEDFFLNGIYAERVRYKTRNSGKPAWSETLRREIPGIAANNSLVFMDVRSSKALDAHENPLSLIQASVIREILQTHGWWLGDAKTRLAELHGFPKPTQRRALWMQILKLNRSKLYSTRALLLSRMLIDYLDATSSEVSGSFLYGVEDFHSVWEHMLRKVLPDVIEGCNARLVKPGYVRRDGLGIDHMSSGMETDIVLRSTGGIKIVDAKYYDAKGSSSVPGWSDIVKQLYYAEAMEIAFPDTPIANCFVFPSSDPENARYSEIKLFSPDKADVARFGKIECIYVNPFDVMTAYVGRQQASLGVV